MRVAAKKDCEIAVSAYRKPTKHSGDTLNLARQTLGRIGGYSWAGLFLINSQALSPGGLSSKKGYGERVINLQQHAPYQRLPYKWLRGWDLNPRPGGYEPLELPDCSTSQNGSGGRI